MLTANHPKRLEHWRRAKSGPFLIEPIESRLLLSTVVVNSVLDTLFPVGSPNISLRNAVEIANTATEPTTITFDKTVFATKQTIVLGGSQLELGNTAHAVTITGPGADRLAISGNDKSRIFMIDEGLVVSISGITITHGNSFDPATDGDYGLHSGGGGIRNLGTLHLADAAIISCIAGFAGGGALRSDGGVLDLRNVTIANNRVEQSMWALGADGGGVVLDGGTASFTECTITGNQVTDAAYGGGVCIFNTDLVEFVGCTITNNTAAASFNGGGGIASFISGGYVTMANSIVAGNHVWGDAKLPYIDVALCWGAPAEHFISAGHNLIGTAEGGVAWTSGDLTGTLESPLNPLLGPLTYNGGPTKTMMPLPGSPALDHGSNALIPAGVTSDQRGYKRIVNGIVDVGAVERHANVTLPAAPNELTAKVLSATSAKLTWKDNSFNEDRFKIEAAFSATGPWTQVTTTSPNNTAITLTGLTAGKTHYFRVRANNSAGDSGYSNIADTVKVPILRFSGPVNYATSKPVCYTLASADLDGDGKLDLIAGTSSSFDEGSVSAIEVMQGNGDGTFRPQVSYPISSFALQVITGDFNGDGKADVAVAEGYGGIGILLNRGDGTLLPEIRTGSYAYSIVAADFNKDSNLDVAASSVKVNVLINKGNAMFAPEVSWDPGGITGWLASADYDGNGQADLAVGGVSVLLNRGGGTFPDHTNYSTDDVPYRLLAGDFNSDGKPDLAVNTENKLAVVLLNKGDGTFLQPVNQGYEYSYNMAAADFNRDGRLDLVAAYFSAGVLAGRGDGTFYPAQVFPATGWAFSIVAGDFNGDEKPDIAMGNVDGGVSVLLNTTVLPNDPGKISGTLFEDKNANGTRDSGEPLLVSSMVYIDKNNNGVFDVGEANRLTDAAGKYSFNLAPGTYRLRKYLRPGYRVTTPAAGYFDVALSAGEIITGRDFGHAFIA